MHLSGEGGKPVLTLNGQGEEEHSMADATFLGIALAVMVGIAQYDGA